MTAIEAIKTELEIVIAETGLAWTVAAVPPSGHAGPCAAIEGWRLRFATRSSLTEYPVLEVTVIVSGINESQAQMVRRIMRKLADRQWTSDDLVVLSGQLSDFTIERDEGARQERWIATGTIEYQVQDIEE